MNRTFVERFFPAGNAMRQRFGTYGHAMIIGVVSDTIRSALGARPAQIAGLVVRRPVPLAVLGVVAGSAGAAAAIWELAPLLYGVTGLSAAVLAAVGAAMAGISAVATLAAAARAAGVDSATV